ncbi:hypothetical protein [Kitasatospora sp. GP82]|uniref:hypothetical protein n=1 Tax=Kitasatospora sp. GP82 TaxID=3035089 RepID=UPI002474C904|nr:hypothetical protein [Kitasatospora sp. GP82]MDH6123614.1 hypothetical protein [Kitasatospora sp. GP82]
MNRLTLPIRELGDATRGSPPSQKCLETAEAIGNALSRRPWVSRRDSGWRIYCRYQGELLSEQAAEALNLAVGDARWGNRCSGDLETVRLTLWVDVPAGEEG